MSEIPNFRNEVRVSKCGEDCGACARRSACAFAFDFLALEIESRPAAGRDAAEGGARLSW